MKCLLLCAGYGTRLYPLTKDRPKPLLPVGNIPLLQRTVDKIGEIEGLDRAYVVSNRRFAGQFEEWSSGYTPEGITLEVVDDGTMTNEDRLGAVGDMDYCIRQAKIDDDLLVLAGDNLILFDLGEFVRFGMEKGLAICLKDLKSLNLASLYGVVESDPDGRVIGFEEKPARPKSSLISIGAYFFRKEHVPLVARYITEGNVPDQTGNYIRWLHRQAPVFGYVIQGQWYDIGDLESYRQANKMFGVG
jgi:glucose-1-phosphate thymidylyltransferase